MPEMNLQETVNRLKANEERFSEFLNELGEYQTIDEVPVETIRSFLARKEIEVNGLLPAANAINADDGAGGSLWVSVQGFINRIKGALGAGSVGYTPAGPDATSGIVENKLRQFETLQDQGGVVDGVTSANTAAQRLKDLDTTNPKLIPKQAVVTLNMVGTERFETTYSFPGETDYIGQYAKALYEGTPVGIDCFGDSTMFGDNGGTGVQSPTTQPSRLQFFLRAYYDNAAATVVNRAISGTDTTSMLNGTDGSGQTFEDRIAASSSMVIYCNHCINDVNGGTSGIQFKKNWIKIIEIIRKYGKSPVMVTPNPMLVVSNPTFDLNAEKIRDYVEIMRQVSSEFAVPLVDQFDLVTRYLKSGDVRGIDVIPDGEHPNETLYKQMGNNLALPFLVGQVIPDANGFLQASLPDFKSTGTVGSKAINLPFSRVGNARWTDSAGTQTIKLAILITETNRDLYLAQILWDQGTTLGAIAIDFVGVGSLSWYQNQPFTNPFSNDYEVAIARNIPPGLHFIECSNGGAGRIGINYLRTRDSMRPKSIKGTGATTTALPTIARRVKMLDKVILQPSTNTDSAIALFDELPSRGLFEEHNVEVVATLEDSQFVVLRGCVNSSLHPSSNYANAIPHLAVGLDGSGFLTCYEFTPGFARATNFDAVDRSGVANTYRFETFGGTLSVFVNGTLIGAPLALLEPDLKGGHVGLYTFNTIQTLAVESLSYVYS